MSTSSSNTTKTASKASAKADTKASAKAEAKDELPDVVTFDVTIRGTDISITLPRDIEDAPFDAAIHHENGRWASFVAALLTEEDAAKLRALRASSTDLIDIFKSYGEAAAGLEENA